MNENGNGLPQPLGMGPGPYDGVPYRGPTMHVKADDPQYRQPQLRHKAYAKVFDLSKDEDLHEYQEIIRKIIRNEAVVGVEQYQYCEDIKNWRIFLRWYDQWLENPEVPQSGYKKWDSGKEASGGR